MKKPVRKEPNSFYTQRYQRYSLPSIKPIKTAESPSKWKRIKEILVDVWLFILGLVLGTAAGFIVLSLLERWLSNGG